MQESLVAGALISFLLGYFTQSMQLCMLTFGASTLLVALVSVISPFFFLSFPFSVGTPVLDLVVGERTDLVLLVLTCVANPRSPSQLGDSTTSTMSNGYPHHQNSRRKRLNRNRHKRWKIRYIHPPAREGEKGKRRSLSRQVSLLR